MILFNELILVKAQRKIGILNDFDCLRIQESELRMIKIRNLFKLYEENLWRNN